MDDFKFALKFPKIIKCEKKSDLKSLFGGIVKDKTFRIYYP
jgi:hypothetical protein